jgi:hypothetical protein
MNAVTTPIDQRSILIQNYPELVDKFPISRSSMSQLFTPRTTMGGNSSFNPSQSRVADYMPPPVYTRRLSDEAIQAQHSIIRVRREFAPVQPRSTVEHVASMNQQNQQRATADQEEERLKRDSEVKDILSRFG